MLSYRRTYYDLFALFISSDDGPVHLPYLQSFQTKYSLVSEKHLIKTGAYYFNDGADLPLNTLSEEEIEGYIKYNSTNILVP